MQRQSAQPNKGVNDEILNCRDPKLGALHFGEGNRSNQFFDPPLLLLANNRPIFIHGFPNSAKQPASHVKDLVCLG